MAAMSNETRRARNWYWWLWISPLFTLPTYAIALILAYFSDLRTVTALLLSALWHLVLLIPSLNKQSDFIRWHGRQALMLAGIRTAVPVVLALFLGGGRGTLWSILILLAVWLFGTRWGQKQAARGECSLADWLGREIFLAPPEPEAVMDGGKDPEALVEIIRFSRDDQERKAALLELAKIGMVEGLDQISAKIHGG